jgi:hypothetical protein
MNKDIREMYEEMMMLEAELKIKLSQILEAKNAELLINDAKSAYAYCLAKGWV